MRIGIANGSELAVEAIRQALASVENHQVVWVARNGAEAVARCAVDTPDLVLMDLLMQMPGGVDVIRRIMAQSPCAVLVVTASIEGNAAKVFEAMGAGALDAVATPTVSRHGRNESTRALLAKIHTVGKLIGEKNGKSLGQSRGDTALFSRQSRLVAIGSSAGGPAALARLLQAFPKDFPGSVVIVQHVDAQFAPGLAAWLNGGGSLPVSVAINGAVPKPGTVLLAGTNDHLVFDRACTLGYTSEPADYAYRPSVDVFFESVARHWRGEVIGVLLTGMGRDGAKGLKTLRRLGHFTIAQDQTTSAVYGMPKAAAEIQAAAAILPLEKIAPAILHQFNVKAAA